MANKETKCRGCGAPIVFVKTAAGKQMPCNPGRKPFWKKPRGSGRVVTIDGEVLSCEFDGPRSEVSGFGFVSHFSTCPNAGSFRKK